MIRATTEQTSPGRLEDAYEVCRLAATSHYENFPVGSFLAPKRLRKHIHAVYAFARGADDIADEGIETTEERLRKLDLWQKQLELCYGGTPTEPVFLALRDTILKCSLPQKDFEDLLVAFRMDAAVTGFGTFQDLLYYSSYSANPVGRLVLTIFGAATPETLPLSDSLCTALQLTNFWQDLSVDLKRGRIYLPLEDCRRFGYTFPAAQPERFDAKFRDLLTHEISRTKKLFHASDRLPGLVPWRLGLELRATWNGGMAILKKVEAAGSDVLVTRPSLGAGDKFRLLASSLIGYSV